MFNFENELNPEAVASTEECNQDTVGAAVAAYEAMGDVEMAMIKADMLEKASTVLSDSISANDALVAKGYESEGGMSPVSTGYEAVCTMLGLNTNAVAGFEAEDDKKAAGLLEKIWKGIKAAAKKVWDAIVAMFSKVTEFVKSLIGKSEATDKLLEKIIAGEVQDPREMTEKEIARVTKQSAILAMFSTKIDTAAFETMVTTQTNIIKSVAKADVTAGIISFEKVLGELSKVTDETFTDVIRKLYSGLIELTQPDFGEDFKVNGFKNKANIALWNKTIDALEKVTDKETLSDSNQTLIGLSKNGVSILFTAVINGENDKTTVKSTVVTFKADDATISDFTKASKGAKTLSKAEIEKLQKDYEESIKLANDVLGKLDVKKLQKSALTVIDTAVKQLAGIELSDVNKGILSNLLKRAESIINSVYPSAIKAISETAVDVSRASVVDYAKLSLIKEEAK